MNLLRLSVTFLLILMINLIRIIASDEHKAQPRISSFITRKSKILQQTENNGLQKLDSANRHKRDAKPRHLSVHGQKYKSGSKRSRNRRQNGSNFGSALYFDGSGQLLQLRSITKQGKITLPDEAFTVQFWAKPEGGQGRLTPIIGKCDLRFYHACVNIRKCMF